MRWSRALGPASKFAEQVILPYLCSFVAKAGLIPFLEQLGELLELCEIQIRDDPERHSTVGPTDQIVTMRHGGSFTPGRRVS